MTKSMLNALLLVLSTNIAEAESQIAHATTLQSRAAAQPWWPFSWDKISVHSFPGASPRFMNSSEVSELSRFNFMNIWGVNATCVNGSTGELIPATCPGLDSRCTCKSTAVRIEDQTFLPVMESSLHAQSRALKAFKAPSILPVLGYLNSAVMQKWSLGQNEFNNNATFAPWHMTLDVIGEVDCFENGCNYQGMEYRVMDFRIPEARAWWVDNVLAPLINSPDIDGTFLDEANQFVSILCPRWNCTVDEMAAVTAGQLAQLDEALAYAASIDKWMMISLTCTFDSLSSYCDAAHASMAKHGHAIRFYEFFNHLDFEYLIYEAQTLKLPIVAHGGRTMRPDWVELSMFLIGAGEYSYWSYSEGWNYGSFPWQPEYDLKLGAPLTPPKFVNVSSSDDSYWTRSFEFLDVTYYPANRSAYMTPKGSK